MATQLHLLGHENPMLSGLSELRAAGALLTQHAAQERGLMQQAAKAVWNALFYREEWPPDLQERTAALEPVLFKYGTIHMTIDQMDEAELSLLRRELLAFIEAAEAAA